MLLCSSWYFHVFVGFRACHPQYRVLQYIEYFELIALEKQQVQEGLSRLCLSNQKISHRISHEEMPPCMGGGGLPRGGRTILRRTHTNKSVEITFVFKIFSSHCSTFFCLSSLKSFKRQSFYSFAKGYIILHCLLIILYCIKYNLVVQECVCKLSILRCIKILSPNQIFLFPAKLPVDTWKCSFWSLAPVNLPFVSWVLRPRLENVREEEDLPSFTSLATAQSGSSVLSASPSWSSPWVYNSL